MSYILTDDVIDLTETPFFIRANHCAMSNVIIDLDTNESFYEIVDIDNSKPSVKLNTNNKSNSQCQDKGPKVSESSKGKSYPFGECPICWDGLGKSQLASTKCGHVYCLKCLEKALQIEKKCPTCRSSLKGKAAYHPLYLSRN